MSQSQKILLSMQLKKNINFKLNRLIKHLDNFKTKLKSSEQVCGKTIPGNNWLIFPLTPQKAHYNDHQYTPSMDRSITITLGKTGCLSPAKCQ